MLKRLVFVIILVVCILFINLNNVFLPAAKETSIQSFSVANTERDIEVISREPHSVNHPVQRATVREYLEFRLEELGYNPVNYIYDSVINRFGKPIEVTNVYGYRSSSEGNPYILLIAHYDSHFKQKVKDKNVLSLGAADDGYGLSVILELIRLANFYKENWLQGVKVLFTDSEESDLEGVKYAIKMNPEIFKDVSLVINIEARGIKGPAILFETSSGSSSVIDLYSHAAKPYGYSLTAAIYSIMPNYTDFTLLKEILPGMNFSVIDNLNFYHTDLDNFDNISHRSIMHYGVQIEPLIKDYLTNQKYSDPDYFRGDSDSLYFTIPYLGLYSFGQTQYLVIKILTFLFFAFVSFIYFVQKRISIRSVSKSLLAVFTYLVVASAAGYFISLVAGKLNGIEFRIISMAYIRHEYVIIASSFLILLIMIALRIVKCSYRKRLSQYDFIFATVLILFLLSLLSAHYIGDSILFFVPLFLSVLSLFTSLFRKSSYISLIITLIIIHFLLPLFYSFIVALTIGSLLFILPLYSLYLWLIIPQLSLFIGKDE